jgi:hypothetical protein
MCKIGDLVDKISYSAWGGRGRYECCLTDAITGSRIVSVKLSQHFLCLVFYLASTERRYAGTKLHITLGSLLITSSLDGGKGSMAAVVANRSQSVD